MAIWPPPIIFLTQAVRRGYVTPNPVFLSLPPSGGVASLLSSQSHIPFGLLFSFQGATKRSFTCSHWGRQNYRVFFKNFLSGDKSPFTYLELQSQNATCFSQEIRKNFSECSAGKKRKRMVLRIRFQICTLPGRFSPFFCPVRRFQKAGKGRMPFCRFLRNVRFRVLKKRLFSCLKFAWKQTLCIFVIYL